MTAFAVLTRLLHLQPPALMEMTESDLTFWLEVARAAVRMTGGR